jgi:signal transduction histidine kinase/Flp pilus assembly protein TadD
MRKIRIHFVGLILVFHLPFTSLAQVSDSLLNILSQRKGKERIETLHELVLANWLNYPNVALTHGEEALSLSQELNDDFLVSKSTRLIAGVYYYRGDYDVSLDYNIQALDIALRLNDSTLINNGFNNIGLLYYNMGSYQTALEYLLRSKAMKEKLGEVYGLPTLLNNIGLVFERVGQFELAREYFEEALKASRKANFLDQEVYSLNNIGTTYLRQRQFKSAETYFKQGWELANRIGNVNWGAVSLRGIGEILESENQLDSAVFYYRQSLEASRSIEDKKGIAEAFYLLAKVSLGTKSYDDALSYLDNSQQLAGQLKLRQQLLVNLKLYSLIYQAMDQEAQVILYLSRYSDLRDSLLQDVVVRNLSLIPLKIKEEEDRLTLGRQQLEIEKKNQENRLFIFMLLVVFPFSIFLFILLRKNYQANRILSQKNIELVQTQSMLITAEKMASLGSLAAGIGHEINNPLNFIKSGSSIIESDLKESAPAKAKEFENYFEAINVGVERASRIVKSLSHFSRLGIDMNEVCNVHDIITNCITILGIRLTTKAELHLDFCENDVFVVGNEGKLHQAFMNILTNAEQAIGEQGEISITTSIEGAHVKLIIKDNGSGIPEEYLNRISDPFFTTKNTGENTGLGLFITYSIINEHGGNISVSSIKNETIFTILLPILITS